MRLAITIGLLAFMQQSGCDNQKTTPAKPVAAKPPLHRFVLTRFPTDAGVAFDTQTGQICRTWEWQPTGRTPAATDPVTGGRPQRDIGEFSPTCLSIYKQYPSGPGDTIDFIPDAQTEPQAEPK